MAIERFPVEASHIMMFARAIGDMLTETERADPRPHVLAHFDLRRMAESYRSLLAA